MIIIIFLLNILLVNSFYLIKHPIEKRIAFIHDIKDITKVDESTINDLQELYKIYPLLIFKNLDIVSPNDFFNFVQRFDNDNYVQLLEYYQRETLQISDNLLDYDYRYQKENIDLLNFFNVKNLNMKLYNSNWCTNTLGNEYKLSNIASGIFIMKDSPIWDSTDFISSETIYENLNPDEQLYIENIFIENKNNIIFDNINIIDKIIPILYKSNNIYEKSKILIMPSLIEKIIGWGTKDSRNWINNFMKNKVLPYKVNIKWEKGDLAIFNNNRFMHTSTPGKNYINNLNIIDKFSTKRLIHTNKPFSEIGPYENNIYSCYNIKWIKEDEIPISLNNNYNKIIINNIINKKINSFA